jgi:hypothetical protein
MVEYLVIYGAVGASLCLGLLLLFCVACTIAGVVKNGVDVDEETEMK